MTSSSAQPASRKVVASSSSDLRSISQKEGSVRKIATSVEATSGKIRNPKRKPADLGGAAVRMSRAAHHPEATADESVEYMTAKKAMQTIAPRAANIVTFRPS